MSDLRLKYPNMTREEIANMKEWKLEQGTYKHRYFYFIGTKEEKDKMKNFLLEKYKIMKYPKGDNNRYDASYKPEIQGILF